MKHAHSRDQNPQPHHKLDALGVCDTRISELVSRVEGEGALVSLMALGMWSGEVRIEETWGSSRYEQSWATLDDEAAMVARKSWWGVKAPLPRQLNRLSLIRDDFKGGFEPEGVDAHAFISCKGTIVGHLSVRTPRDPLALHPLCVDLARAFEARCDAIEPGGELGHVVTSATGRRLAWSTGAKALLERSWGQVCEQLRDALDCPDDPLPNVGPWGFTVHGMENQNSRAHVFTLSRLAPVRIDWRASLTPRQLEVLDATLVHQTIPRTAKALSTTQDNVKYHLKTIYERLGVSTRAELVAMFHACLHPSPIKT